jgi:hypothetical protein
LLKQEKVFILQVNEGISLVQNHHIILSTGEIVLGMLQNIKPLNGDEMQMLG